MYIGKEKMQGVDAVWAVTNSLQIAVLSYGGGGGGRVIMWWTGRIVGTLHEMLSNIFSVTKF